MDVHPIKNVSIGIDPYPIIGDFGNGLLQQNYTLVSIINID